MSVIIWLYGTCFFKLASGTQDGESMLVKYDWYIVPVLNPDGYEYSVSYNIVNLREIYIISNPLNVIKIIFNSFK